jgi:glycerol uptake facilitator-like aquaporin
MEDGVVGGLRGAIGRHRRRLSSLCHLHPLIAIARALTDTFSGIRRVDVPAFIFAELGGAVIAVGLMSWLRRAPGDRTLPINPERTT